MKIQWKKFLFALALPLGAGGLSTLLTGGMQAYSGMIKPPLSPPGWVFPVVWSILYLLMGYASYRVWVSDADPGLKRRALVLYLLQLAANFIWPLLFFGGRLYLAALVWLVVLWILIFLTVRAFSKVDEPAADLLLPYLLWVTFAAYLNFGVFLLN